MASASVIYNARAASPADSFPQRPVNTPDHVSQPSTSAAPSGPRKRGRKPHPRLPDLQQRLNALADQYNQLSKENGFLRNKLKVLERVVPYRDESVGHLTQLLSSVQAAARAPRPTPVHAPPQPAQFEQAPGSPDHAPTVSGASQSSRAGPAAGETLPVGRRASGGSSCGCEATSGMAAACAPDLYRPSMAPAAPAQPAGVQCTDTAAAVALCPGPDGDVPPLTPAAAERLTRTTAEDFRALWKHICLQMGVLVSGAQVHGSGSSPHVRLERYVERALSYVEKIKVLAPACFVQSMYTNLDSGEHERPNENFWVTCGRSLQLTPQQLAEAASLADVYTETVAPLLQQRVQLAAQLSSSLAAARSQPACTNDAVAALHAADGLAQQLERSVMREHQAHWDMNDYLCTSVLTPLQVAKALTAAYPYVPDGVAMLHAFKQIASSCAPSSVGSLLSHAPQAPVPAQQPAGNAVLANLAGLLAAQLPALAAANHARLGCAAPVQPARPAPPPLPQPATAPAAAALAALLAGLQGAQRPPVPVAPPPQYAYAHSVLAGLQAAHMLGRAAA